MISVRKTIEQYTGLLQPEIERAKSEIEKGSVKNVLLYYLENAIDDERMKYDKISPEELKAVQGTVKGLQMAIGIVNKFDYRPGAQNPDR